jgi:hypothetical protein
MIGSSPDPDAKSKPRATHGFLADLSKRGSMAFIRQHVDLTLRELVDLCHRIIDGASYCLEALRRALIDGDAEALDAIYRLYLPEVLHWVRQHSAFEHVSEPADHLALDSLNQFYFAVRGPKFAGFETLRAALAYLKMCVNTVMLGRLPSVPLVDVQPAEPGSEQGDDPIEQLADPDAANVERELAFKEYFRDLIRLFPDRHDQLLLYCYYTLQMKPAQIVVRYRKHFADENVIRVRMQRIRRTLLRQPEIQSLLQRRGYKNA